MGDTYHVVINIGEDCHRHPHPHPLVLTKIGPFSEQSLPDHERGEPMTVEMTATQQVDVTYGAPVDKKGNPAKVQNIKWASSDENVVKPWCQDPKNAPFTATVIGGAPGAAEITIVCDADLGEGIKPIAGDPVGFHIVAGEATAMGEPTVGTPVEQPEGGGGPPPAGGGARRK